MQRAFNRVARQQGLMGIELKFKDYSLCSGNINDSTAEFTGGAQEPDIDNAGAATPKCLNSMGRGDGPENRDGDRIIMKKIDIFGLIRSPVVADATTAKGAKTVFLALVLWKATNSDPGAAGFKSENVFDNVGADSNLLTCPLRNLAHSKLYKVLWRKRYVIPNVGAVYDGSNIEEHGGAIHFAIHHKFKGNGLPVQFSGSGSTLGSIADNSLHLVAFATPNNGRTATICYNSRLRFVG